MTAVVLYFFYIKLFFIVIILYQGSRSVFYISRSILWTETMIIHFWFPRLLWGIPLDWTERYLNQTIKWMGFMESALPCSGSVNLFKKVLCIEIHNPKWTALRLGKNSPFGRLFIFCFCANVAPHTCWIWCEKRKVGKEPLIWVHLGITVRNGIFLYFISLQESLDGSLHSRMFRYNLRGSVFTPSCGKR